MTDMALNDPSEQKWEPDENQLTLVRYINTYLAYALKDEFRRQFGVELLVQMPESRLDPKRALCARADGRKVTKTQEAWIRCFQVGWRCCSAAFMLTTRVTTDEETQ